METDDSEIWSKNLKCLVCRISCEDEAKKTEHQETKEHMKRWKVKQFIDESLDRITTAVSQMHERYKLKKLPIIGLEECFEIQQEGLSDQEKANFWACNLCYEAGATYDSADIHLTSMQHIKNYLDENESDKNEKIEKECKNDECDKYEKYRAAAEEVFTANGGIKGIQSAQVLRLMLNTDDGRKKLGIEDQMEVTFRPCPKNAQKIILFCSTCNEVKPVHLSGKYTNEKACVNHCESLDHQRCSRIMAVMNEFEPQEIYDEYRTSETVSQLHWQEKKPGTWYLSQPCGYRYSIRAGKETMCTVCFALVKSENILEHFTSEFHIMKYLNMINSYHSYVTHQLIGTDRRAKALLTLKGTITLENDTKKIAQTLTRLPNFIKSQLMEDVHKYEDPPLEIIDDFIDSTGKVYRFCHSCTTFMEFDHNIVDTPIKMNFAWKSHVLSDHHFEIAAMRNRINFDPKYFVPYSPTIHNIDTEIKGVWKVDKDVLIQTQCDVGLEYMVEDEQANEVVCQCCWKIFSKNLVFVNQHIRSYEHLKQYIFMCAPNMVRTLLSPESDLNKQAFLMEYLQKSSGHFKKRIHLYSKLKSSELSSWTPISQRLVLSSLYLDSLDKEAYETAMNLVDKVACDGEENATYSAREALIAANMLIINTTRANQNELGSIVCRCESCELLVVVNAETWQNDVFTNHMFSDEHKRRTVLIKENTVSAFGIQTKKSDYTVKPLDQKDKTKLQKVTWQWKDQSKQHEYVASVVGLDCVIERRYPSMEFGIPKQGSDFYCQICAVVFQKRHESLHSHVRSLDHCVNWIHKYRPSHIRDLLKHQANQSVDKGKDLRKFLLSVLKDVNPPEDYCMLVYDPIGEEERKQLAIMTKIQAEERRKTKMIKEAEKAEILKKREEDRRQKEEQMRKQREREQDEEKAKKALREARLKYAKEHVGKYQNKETPEEAALKNRLAHATSLENQKKRFDLQKAKLEAEKTQLLSTNPYAAVSNAPKLVVMPQLRTQPQPQSPYGNIAGVPPPSLNVQPPVAFFGTRPPIIQQIQPTGGLSMTFSKSITDHTPATKELAAYKKRPSLRGKRVDPAIHNTVAISNKTDLLNYMRRQGADEIVDPSEIPREFSQSVQDSPDAFGIEYVAEVVCLDDTALDSYLCTVCDCWSDPKGMLRHLSSTDHKSTYMYHKYPHYHAEVNREKDPVVRRNVFKNFTKDLKGKNVADVVNTRMKTLLDKETIARLWVGYEEYFFSKSTSSSWSSGGFKPVSGPSVVLPKVVPVERLINDDDDDDGDENHAMNLDRREVTRKRTDSSRRDRSRDRSRRSRSREYDRRQSRRRSRTRSRSRSSDRYYRDRSRRDRRSRSRSCSESRSRSRSPECPPKKLRTDSWTAQTDSFLAKLGSDVSVLPTAAPQVSTESTTAADFNSKLATVRDLAASGHIQGTQIDSLAASPQKEPAPVVPTQSTEDRRRMEREKAEYEANLSRKVMGALMLLDQLFKEYEGNVPNHLISDIYKQVGLNESEGDEAMQKFLQSINNVILRIVEFNRNPIFRKNPMVPKQTITQSISSLGIQLNTTPVNVKYNQADSHYPQQAGPSIHPQQYGISSQPQTSSSAYSQAFHGSTVQTARPLSPISAAIVPLRSSTVYAQQHQQPTQSFYQNPPTAMNHDIKSSEASIANNRSNDSDDSSDDEDYKEVYQLLGTKKSQTQQKKETNVLQKEQLEEPIIPGQKMALKRTILPNGARVGEVQAVQLQPTVVASPTPSDASTTNLVIRTPNSAATDSTQVAQDIPQIIRPTLESSLGMPAPITVTKQVQQPIHQPQMVNYLPHQQGYQMNVPVSMYQHQPVYQQPPMQPPMQPQINYQQQQQVYQQPPSQPHYPQQYVHQPQMYQQQPQQQPGYPQQYYQQPPPQQYYQQPLQQVQHPLSQQQQPVQSNVAPTYGISGAPQQPQQYYWPPR